MQKRKNGIDIIKTLAIIFVPSLHWFLNYGFFEVPYVGVDKIILVMLRYICFTCIGLFIMSTGYLQCNKMPEWSYFKKISKYVMLYVIYAVIDVLLLSGVNDISIKAIVKNITTFPGYTWYMAFFFGFYFLLPYINILLKNIEKESFQKLIFILVIVIAIPEFINGIPILPPGGDEKLFLLPNWWKDFFPLLFYALGAYFRKYEPKVSKVKATAGIFLVAGFFAVAGYFLTMGNSVPVVLNGGYGNAVCVFISVCIFGIFYDVDVKNKLFYKCIMFTGSITLSIYLGLMVSDSYTLQFMQRYFAEWYYSKSDKLFFVEFPLNFLLSFVLACIVEFLWRMSARIFNKLKTGDKVL